MKRGVFILVAAFTQGFPPPAAADDPRQPSGEGPVAVPTADVDRGPVPLRVCFDASESHHLERRPLAIWWDFGDGHGATSELRPCHEYVQPGLYAATLTVTDDRGLEDSRALIVSVGESP